MRIARLSLVLAALACGKRTEITGPAPTGLAAAVVGTWNLTQVCGGLVATCRDPGTVSAPNRVVFYANGTTDLYRAGVSTPTRGSWSVIASKTDSLRAGTAILSPGLEAATDTLSLTFSIEGELMLAEPCCDRFQYTFVRHYPPD